MQVRNVLLTVALFCGPMLICFSFLNTVAIAYHSTAALPFGTICVIFVIWALITFPLTVLGGIAGKNKQVCLMAGKQFISSTLVIQAVWPANSSSVVHGSYRLYGREH